jgi:ADP-ribose pyrophosphatase
MADEHLLETLLESESLFTGRFLSAKRDIVRLSDGGTGTREYVVHPGAVVVIPLLDDGRVVIERQYRHPVQRVMIEFPAGKLDAGEDPLACGKRELLEETGYSAREWAYAGAMHLAIAYSTEIIHIYFARGLTLGERALDEGEHLDVESASLQELQAWAQSGQLTDAKSLTCLLWLQNVRSGAWALQWQPSANPAAAPQ